MFLLLLNASCSDYNLQEKTAPVAVDTGPGPAPALVVEPELVEELGHCGEFQQQLTIGNRGAGLLVIDNVLLEGSGWGMDPAPLPIELEPSALYSFQLYGELGMATLSLFSNDPVEPRKDVELIVTPDQPPSSSITSPYSGAVLAVGGTVLIGQVGDDVDSPGNLVVGWSSDLDGALTGSPPGADGSVAVEWSSERSAGVHNVTLSVTDTCGNQTDSSLSFCQQYGYEVENLDISTWNFEGSAHWDSSNEWLELTPPAGNQVGTAFSTAVEVDGGNVEIEFLFYMGEGSGADGISLTALDTDRMTTFLGGTGCGIGYGGDASCTAGPALPGWSIEIDSYYNGGQDPTEEDHVAFTFDGDVDAPAAWTALPEMEDNGWHSMVVRVQEPHVVVEIDGVAYIDQDLSGNFAFPAYIGFTAGTGGATNRHLIDSLVVTETVCEEL
jgi:hypothetical protein